MNNELSKEELTNIIKIYKIFNDEEISMMINEPNLISDNNIRLSLIKLINNEDNVLNKMHVVKHMYLHQFLVDVFLMIDNCPS